MLRLPKQFSFYSTTLLLDIAVVVVLAGIASGWWVSNKTEVSTASVFSYNKQASVAIKSGIPTRISIAGLGLDLSVQLGSYQADGNWTLDDHNSFYAAPSVPANNEKGTTLIYGHNTKPVFKNLKNLTPGNELIVQTDSGYTFTYEYSFVSDVDPGDVSIFNTENTPNITLQTCSGAWDELRSMYTFTLKNVVKS